MKQKKKNKVDYEYYRRNEGSDYTSSYDASSSYASAERGDSAQAVDSDTAKNDTARPTLLCLLLLAMIFFVLQSSHFTTCMRLEHSVHSRLRCAMARICSSAGVLWISMQQTCLSALRTQLEQPHSAPAQVENGGNDVVHRLKLGFFNAQVRPRFAEVLELGLVIDFGDQSLLASVGILEIVRGSVLDLLFDSIHCKVIFK